MIDRLGYLLAVARERNVHRAAEVCGGAQPTLSAGIKALAGVHHHLVTFRTPTMIRTMRDHLAHHPAGADPLVWLSMQHDPHGPSPVDKVVSPMLGGGQIASDEVDPTLARPSKSPAGDKHAAQKTRGTINE